MAPISKAVASFTLVMTRPTFFRLLPLPILLYTNYHYFDRKYNSTTGTRPLSSFRAGQLCRGSAFFP